MPRGCGCAGNSCGCLIVNGAGILVEGTGAASSPYVVSLSNESGYRLELASDWGNAVNLQNTVAGDIVIEIAQNFAENVSVALPDSAPLGTHLDLIMIANVSPVTWTVTYGSGLIYYPGGVVPVLTAGRNMIRFIFGTQAGGAGTAWYGVPHLAMA